MAINFPNSPANGDIYGNFTYDTSIPGWRKTPENSASLPAGTIVQWPGATAPANWLICDGASVSRTTYASLFAAIGVQYGSGDGTTTFNLPNLKGRVAVGLDSSQTEFDTLGETGGAKTHTLTSAEMPSHSHTQDAHTHTFSGSTNTTGAHTHSLNGKVNISQNGYGQNSPINGNAGNFADGTAYSAGDHSHTFSGTTSSTTATNQSTGGGGAHNNLQPYIVLNYIIKTSAGITSGDSELATRVGVVENANNLTPQSPNYIINGAMDFWQRGTSFSASGYTADRWGIIGAVGQTPSVSQQTFTPGAAPVSGYESTYYARVAWSGTPSGTFWFTQKVEDVRTLAGQTATLSFWARASSSTSTFIPVLEQNFGSGGSSVVTTLSSAITLTTSWQRFSATFSVPSVAGKTIGTSSYLEARPLYGGASVNGINIDIWGVQLEAGAYATPFRRNAPSIQAELAACQRYFEKSFPYNVAPANGPNTTSFATTEGLFGYVSGNSMQTGFLTFSVPKRVGNPTMTIYGNSSGHTKYRDSITSSTDLWSAAAFTVTTTSERGCLLQQNVVNNVVVPIQGHWTANAEL